MPSVPSAAAARAATSQPTGPAPDQLGKMQQMVVLMRDLEADIEELSERLKEKNKELNELIHSKLPSLMEEAGVNVVGVPASGNYPAVEARLRPFYSANIAASWDQERKDKAFAWLDKNGHGDLIKTEVKVSFSRGALKVAQSFAAQASKKKGASVDLKQTVPSQTLTAWLREEVEKRKSIPPKTTLELLGATVGKKVDIAEVKKK